MGDPRSIVASTVFQLMTPPAAPDLVAQPAHWGCTVAVPVQLRFERTDPFAVHLRFTTGPSRDVCWVFARALLTDGLLAAAGEGDVRVWPSPDADRDVVVVELSSPSGHARFEASASEVADFLDRTFELVRPGTESALVDLDAALAALLTTDGR